MAKNGRAAVATPKRIDTLGDAGRAQIAVRMIASLQEQAEVLEMTRIANEHKESDLAPGVAGEGGEPVSYAVRRAQLQEAEDRIMEAYADLRPAIEAAAVEQFKTP